MSRKKKCQTFLMFHLCLKSDKIIGCNHDSPMGVVYGLNHTVYGASHKLFCKESNEFSSFFSAELVTLLGLKKAMRCFLALKFCY